MIVGDKVLILPTEARKRYGEVITLQPVIQTNPPLVEIRRDRANGVREWVALWNLQVYGHAPN